MILTHPGVKIGQEHRQHDDHGPSFGGLGTG